MATAFHLLIQALDARVNAVVDPALKQLLDQAKEAHAAEAAEIQQLRDDYSGLKKTVDAFTGGADLAADVAALTEQVAALAPADLTGVHQELDDLGHRVEALEARNAADDAEAANLPAGALSTADASAPGAPAAGDNTAS